MRDHPTKVRDLADHALKLAKAAGSARMELMAHTILPEHKKRHDLLSPVDWQMQPLHGPEGAAAPAITGSFPKCGMSF